MTKKTKKIIIISAACVAAIGIAAGVTLGVMFGGHVHNIELVKREKAATCTEDGNVEYWYCEDCETSFADEDATSVLAEDEIVLAATGHTWDEGRLTVEPDCVNAGETTYTCVDCGAVRTEPVKALDHDYAAIKWDELSHWTACTRCGKEEEGSRKYHDFVTDSSSDSCADCGQKIVYSEGLNIVLAEDGKGYTVAGAGSFSGANLFIPEKFDDGVNGELPVTAIAANAFERNIHINAVRLPDTVTQIGENAFFYCSNLAIVTLPEGLKEVGDGAFYGCSALKEIVIPASVSYIGAQAFYESGLSAAEFVDPVGWTAAGVAADLSDSAAAAELLRTLENALVRKD